MSGIKLGNYLQEYVFTQTKEDVINKLNELVQQNTYVFRGFSKKTEMSPKIIRDKDYSKYEMEFLREFERYGSQYFNADML